MWRVAGAGQVRRRSVDGLPLTLLEGPARTTPRPFATEAAIMLAATNETDLEVSLAATTAGEA